MADDKPEWMALLAAKRIILSKVADPQGEQDLEVLDDVVVGGSGEFKDCIEIWAEGALRVVPLRRVFEIQYDLSSEWAQYMAKCQEIAVVGLDATVRKALQEARRKIMDDTTSFA